MSNATTTTGVDSPTPPPPTRHTGRRILVWSIGILVIGGMLIAILLPSLCRAREPANRVKCASNLKQIGQAIALYAHDNAGRYPPSLAELSAREDLSPEVMICPSSNDERTPATQAADIAADLSAAETNAPGHKHCLSYLYVGSTFNTNSTPPTAVVAYEPLDNHDRDGTNVLFADGHVDWIDKRTWPAVAAAAGIRLAPPPTTRP